MLACRQCHDRLCELQVRVSGRTGTLHVTARVRLEQDAVCFVGGRSKLLGQPCDTVRVSLLQPLGIVQLFAMDVHVVTPFPGVMKPLQLPRSSSTVSSVVRSARWSP